MPLFLQLGKSVTCKKYHLNLNNYHTWNFHARNNLKQLYTKMVQRKLPEDMRLNKVKVEFTMHRGDKKRVDRANVLSIHEKFFCDALTKSGIIEDDNDKFVESTLYRTGEIDKGNPRVVIEVIELENEPDLWEL